MKEVSGTFQCHDFAGRTDNFSQIKRGIAGTGSEIENTLADGNARSLPTIQPHRTPDPVLQPKSDQLFVVGSENIILLAHVGIISTLSSLAGDCLPMNEKMFAAAPLPGSARGLACPFRLPEMLLLFNQQEWLVRRQRQRAVR